MPHLDPLTVAVWVLTASTQAIVLGAMTAAHTWRRWPSLYAFLAILNVRESLLVVSAAAGSGFVYFWSYWLLGAAAQVAQLFVILEVSRCLVRGTAWLDRLVVSAIPPAAGMVLIVTSLLALLDKTPAYYRIVYLVHRWDVAVCLSWLIVFITVIICSRGVGIQWSLGARGVGAGFLIEALSTTVSSLLTLHAQTCIAAGVFRSAMYLATLIIWSAAVLPRTAPVVSSSPIAAFRVSHKRSMGQ